MRDLLKEFLRKDRPWIIITSGFFLFTLYDFFEHTGREGSAFEQKAFWWFLFSVFSFATVVMIMFLVTRGLGKLFRGMEVVRETIGLLTAAMFHIYVSGPLYNKIFWSDDTLHFEFRLIPLLVFSGIYLFLRLVVFNGIIYFVKRRKGSIG